jgi:hypothetical protein
LLVILARIVSVPGHSYGARSLTVYIYEVFFICFQIGHGNRMSRPENT